MNLSLFGRGLAVPDAGELRLSFRCARRCPAEHVVCINRTCTHHRLSEPYVEPYIGCKHIKFLDNSNKACMIDKAI